MKIEFTPRDKISLDFDLQRIITTPDVVLDFETSYNFDGRAKEENKIVLFKITYYLIFTDIRSNEQLLHYIIAFGCVLTKDLSSRDTDFDHLHTALESIYADLWEGLQVQIPYLQQKVLVRPYVSPEFVEKIMAVLNENGFYA